MGNLARLLDRPEISSSLQGLVVRKYTITNAPDPSTRRAMTRCVVVPGGPGVQHEDEDDNLAVTRLRLPKKLRQRVCSAPSSDHLRLRTVGKLTKDLRP